MDTAESHRTNTPRLPLQDVDPAISVLKRTLCRLNRALPLSPLEHFTTLLAEEIRAQQSSVAEANEPAADLLSDQDLAHRAVHLLRDLQPPASVLLERLAEAYGILSAPNGGIGVLPKQFNRFVAEFLDDMPAFIQLNLVGFLQRASTDFFVPFNEFTIAANVCTLVRKLLRDLESKFVELCDEEQSRQMQRHDRSPSAKILPLDTAVRFVGELQTSMGGCDGGGSPKDVEIAALESEDGFGSDLEMIRRRCGSAAAFDAEVEKLVCARNQMQSHSQAENLERCCRSGRDLHVEDSEEAEEVSVVKGLKRSARKHDGGVPLEDFQRVICLHLTPLALTSLSTSPPPNPAAPLDSRSD